MRTLVLLLSFLFAASAQAQQPLDLSAETRALVQRIDAHINTQKTMQSRFVQLDGFGGFLEGTLFWNRPDQARFEYDPPSPLLLIASGLFLIEVDRELQQVTHYPQVGSIADYLLAENMLQNPELAISRLETTAHVINIDIFERDDPENGIITLGFNANSLDLQHWVIHSADGAQTTVNLIEPRFNLLLEDTLFRFRKPKEWEIER